jgi:hypothetical protein
MDPLDDAIKEDMDSLEKALQEDGKCTTGVVAGMTPEEVVKRYPKIVIDFMKGQQSKIDALELEIEQLNLSRQALANELREKIGVGEDV